ncbi:HK97 family phage prohead protease [Bacteroides reticulotermitis]|uniref:HK97 family phage prohead protease n=1 Tax=Bacteroides reticulotermitis TaxID=1133319 RepID=UPI003A8B66A9
MEKYEIRSFGGEAAPKIVSERTIQGSAVVFGQESRVMFDTQRKRFFVEIIEPGAVSEELLRSSDVKALLEHNRGRMLARSFQGAGSLTLSVDSSGVNYRFDAPDTPDGACALEGVKRRDFFGSSFAYLTNEKENVTYEKRADGMLLRRVKKITHLFDVSIVSDPAYMGTDVNVRSLDAYFEEPTDEKYKSEIAELRNLSKK